MFPNLMEELLVYHRDTIIGRDNDEANKQTIIFVEDRQSLTGVTFLYYRGGYLINIERDANMRKMLHKISRKLIYSKFIVILFHFIIFTSSCYIITKVPVPWHLALMYYVAFLPVIPYSKINLLPILTIVLSIGYTSYLIIFYIIQICTAVGKLNLAQIIVWIIILIFSIVLLLVCTILNLDIAINNISYNRVKKKMNL
ncbi:MAG: hypothetical protein KH415_00750 [Clostridium sp.]|nr:hypothetical protein [Clostridium sp.]